MPDTQAIAYNSTQIFQKQSSQYVGISLQELFDRGLKAHLAGNTSGAQQDYEAYLSHLQSLPVARTNLAAIYLQQGRYEEAQRLLDLALLEAPRYCEALSNRGYLALLQGDQDRGLSLLEKAIAVNPAMVPALTHLLPLYRTLGRHDEALAVLNRALALDPQQPALLEQRAQVLLLLEGVDSAEACLRMALEHAPEHQRPGLFSALARLFLHHSTDLPAALAIFEDAISLSSQPAIADLVNKGEILRRLSRRGEAVDWVNQCLARHPQDAGLINLKACILQDLGQVNDALTLYEMALVVAPADAQIHANRGFLLNDQGRHLEAQTGFMAGLTLNPSHAGCHHGLAQAAFNLSKPALAHQHFLRATELEPENLNIWDNFLYFLSFVHHVSDQTHLLQCHRYASLALAPRVGASSESFVPELSDASDRPLRIGIISAEIGSHCVSYFLLSLVRGCDPSMAQFFIFPSKDRHSEARWQEFETLACHFECIEQLSDDQACHLIRGFNLDVVLETSQHMTANRLALMARRLAPVQAHYIGMHGTTGVPAVDYFIGDAWITPPEFSGQFTEALLRLNRTWVCYTPPDQLPPLRVTEGKPPLRLGCFNNVTKISRPCLKLWAKVMLELPDATLTIKDSLRRSPDSALTDHQNSVVAYLVRRGVASDRIRVIPRTDSWDAHMDLYNDIDIALDTLPLASGTTAFDALLMGTPLVAHSSEWIGGRLSASIVAGLGMHDWIASSDEGYVAAVKKLARGLIGLRKGRAARRKHFLASELCDQQDLAFKMISTLRAAYQKTLAVTTDAATSGMKGHDNHY